MTDTTTTPPPPKVRSCGTPEYDAALLESDHAYAIGRVRAEEHVQMAQSSDAVAARTEVTVIPVVVHVLVDPANPATDVTRAQIVEKRKSPKYAQVEWDYHCRLAERLDPGFAE